MAIWVSRTISWPPCWISKSAVGSRQASTSSSLSVHWMTSMNCFLTKPRMPMPVASSARAASRDDPTDVHVTQRSSTSALEVSQDLAGPGVLGCHLEGLLRVCHRRVAGPTLAVDGRECDENLGIARMSLGRAGEDPEGLVSMAGGGRGGAG